MWQREKRAPGSGGQRATSAAHVGRAAGRHRSRCRRDLSSLDTVKTLEQAIHAGPARACRHARPASDRHRRDRDPQRPQLPHRGQRPRSQRPIWFGGTDRSEASMAAFYDWLGRKKSRKIRLAVMDMWRPFRTVAQARRAASGDPVRQVPRHAPLGEALEQVRKSRICPPLRQDRRYIKGQKYTLLSRRENLTPKAAPGLKTLLRRQQTIEHRLPAQGVFGHCGTTKARARAALLRELARSVQMAAFAALREDSPT